MKRSLVFETSPAKLLEFKVEETDLNVIVELFGIKVIVGFSDLDKESLFIHVDKDDDEITNVTILPFMRFDYILSTNMNELFLKSYKVVSETEIAEEKEIEMILKLKNLKIKDIKLQDEVKGIALRVAVQSIIDSGVLGDATIEKEEGKAYLVKGGEVEELTGIGFRDKAYKFLIGKTLEEIESISNNSRRKDHIMVKLIEGLDLIQGVTLERESSGILG